MANEKNLISLSNRTTSEQREIAKKGGIKSGEARRAKKLLSQNFAEYLAKEHDVVISGQRQRISGQKLVNSVVSKVLAKGDRSSVDILRLMWEATESPPAPQFDINKWFAKL